MFVPNHFVGYIYAKTASVPRIKLQLLLHGYTYDGRLNSYAIFSALNKYKREFYKKGNMFALLFKPCFSKDFLSTFIIVSKYTRRVSSAKWSIKRLHKVTLEMMDFLLRQSTISYELYIFRT